MDNLFIKYMSERSGKSVHKSGELENVGPVITISRPYGCDGERIAQKLSLALSDFVKQKGDSSEWKLISKEILENSAKELKLAPSLIDLEREFRLKGIMDHITLFFSNDFYPSDRSL